MEQEISDQDIEALLGQLTQCTEACIQTIIHCLKEGGLLADLNLIKLLMDCSQMCQIAESFFLRESNYGGDVIDLCSDICEAAADACSRFPDKVLKSCESICRNCSQACDNIIIPAEEMEEE